MKQNFIHNLQSHNNQPKGRQVFVGEQRRTTSRYMLQIVSNDNSKKQYKKHTCARITKQQLDSAVSQLWEAASLAYLITESNIKAYALPVMLFVMLGVVSGAVTTKLHPSWEEVATAFPHVALYAWLFVLHFDCSNQKHPDSIKEDSLNKPWRAIPSGRLTIDGAEWWYFSSSCLLLLATAWLGGFMEATIFMLETWVYDFAGGARSWWGKNLIGALFFMTGQLGGTRVAANSMHSTSISKAGCEWCVLLGLTTLTTIQIQDLRDQEGDRACGRRTLPVVAGDRITRRITALFISFWSIACPSYWGNGRFTIGSVLPLLIGGTISVRVLLCRGLAADRSSLNFYTVLWLPALYSIPLLSRYELL